jgi:hypothetical protein
VVSNDLSINPVNVIISDYERLEPVAGQLAPAERLGASAKTGDHEMMKDHGRAAVCRAAGDPIVLWKLPDAPMTI